MVSNIYSFMKEHYWILSVRARKSRTTYWLTCLFFLCHRFDSLVWHNPVDPRCRLPLLLLFWWHDRGWHGMVHCKFINSLAPGRSECDSKNAIFNLVLLIGIFRSSHDNSLRWMPQGLTDDQSTLAQVMAWCRQATSHYLSQCWPRSLSPYCVTRPQWVKTAAFPRRGALKVFNSIHWLYSVWKVSYCFALHSKAAVHFSLERMLYKAVCLLYFKLFENSL